MWVNYPKLLSNRYRPNQTWINTQFRLLNPQSTKNLQTVGISSFQHILTPNSKYLDKLKPRLTPNPLQFASKVHNTTAYPQKQTLNLPIESKCSRDCIVFSFFVRFFFGIPPGFSCSFRVPHHVFHPPPRCKEGCRRVILKDAVPRPGSFDLMFTWTSFFSLGKKNTWIRSWTPQLKYPKPQFFEIYSIYYITLYNYYSYIETHQKPEWNRSYLHQLNYRKRGPHFVNWLWVVFGMKLCE